MGQVIRFNDEQLKQIKTYRNILKEKYPDLYESFVKIDDKVILLMALEYAITKQKEDTK